MTATRRTRLTLPRFRGYQRRLTAPERLAALTVQAATVARLQADAAGHCRALAERDERIAFLEARLRESTAALRGVCPWCGVADGGVHGPMCRRGVRL